MYDTHFSPSVCHNNESEVINSELDFASTNLTINLSIGADLDLDGDLNTKFSMRLMIRKMKMKFQSRKNCFINNSMGNKLF